MSLFEMMTRKVVDEKNSVDVRRIVLTNRALLTKSNDANVIFEGNGQEQLLSIVDSMGGDFHWKLEWRPTKEAHLEKCDHSSSIVIHEWKEYRITLLLCTWACGETYWTITEGITSHEISAAEACKKIVGR